MTKEEFTKMKQELEAYVIFVAFVNCACFNALFNFIYLFLCACSPISHPFNRFTTVTFSGRCKFKSYNQC